MARDLPIDGPRRGTNVADNPSMLRIYDPELHNAVKTVVDYILRSQTTESVEALIEHDLKARAAALILQQLVT